MVEEPPHNVVSGYFDAALAFVAGLSVLVRPELALIGGLALIMMLIAARGWRRRGLIVLAGGLLPVGYEIFRMGYYALLVPGTALAKDASGSKWPQGFVYLANFNRPYLLWVPAVLLLAHGRGAAHHPHPALVDPPRGSARLRVAGPHGPEPGRRGGFHRRQRAVAGRLLDSYGRRLYAWAEFC